MGRRAVGLSLDKAGGLREYRAMAKLEDTTFRAVDASDEEMFGEPAVLLAGLSAADQVRVRALMDEQGLAEVRAIVVTRDTLELTLEALAVLPAGSGMGGEEKLPRAILMSGLTQRQFHALMDGYRGSGMARPLWAAVTPVSGQWTAKQLLIELLGEQKAMREAMERKKAEGKGEG